MPDPFTILHFTAFVILGLCFGSFASALIHRVPNDESPWRFKDRSACPSCGYTLRARDLIPLVSWLLSRGKCRNCGAEIGRLYPALELSAMLMAILLFIFYTPVSAVEHYLTLFSVPILLSLFVIDLRHKILPNTLVLILLVLGALRLSLITYEGAIPLNGIALHYIGGAFVYGLFSLSLGWLVQIALRKKALGMGDVKFFFVAGLWLGLPNLGVFCFLSGMLGVLIGAIWQKIKKEAAFPFGPALIISFFVLLLL